ncbi:heavy metal translocating P-type ATPase [Halocatena marina]|uniref:heavy metal translocating P-type ATPase n=1 Tax=Halocatena marina TaxID=2934937 RepID=UPI002232A065|nr:heavy metal translocating P-type ATPase [Halocatena marina]
MTESADDGADLPHCGQDHDHCHEHPHDDVNASSSTDSTETTISLDVPDMDCPSCAGKVENSLRKLDGIEDLEPQVTTGVLSVTYDSGRVSADDVVQRVEAAGYSVQAQNQSRTATFAVPDMDCPSCAGKVENSVQKLDGVESYETRPTIGQVTVTYDDRAVTPGAIEQAIENAGYPVEAASTEDSENNSTLETASSDETSVWQSRRATKTALSGVLLGLGLLVEWALTGLNTEVVSVLSVGFTTAEVFFLAGIVLGGQAILRNGYYSARNLNLDIDFLMSAAIVSAVVASLIASKSLYFEAATLAFLFSTSELLERHSMDRTRSSLRELMDLSPDEATVRRDGETMTIPVDAVQIGDRVVVRPGEKIPMDGTVREGESAVNQAPITGESVPVDKTLGDAVYAGTINEEGYLEVEVTSAVSDNTISRIVDLIENAQSNKTEREQFVERFANYYTPVMVGVAVLVAAVPPLLFSASWVEWLVAGITMLVLACPCAFVISTPVSVVSGITSAAKNGVLIKGGNHLEAMGAVETVAVDKTGTLTKGELVVTDVVPLGEHTDEDVLRCARGLETRSEHPIGEAIVAHTDGTTVAREISDFESLTGRGVRADLDGTRHYAGKPELFDDLGFDLGHAHVVNDGNTDLSTEMRNLCDQQGCLNLVTDTIPRLQSDGKTVILVGREDELEGIIAVADAVRPAAREMIERLHELGVRVVMLTGDNEGTARAIADEVGVDDYRAELLPEDKVTAVEALMTEHDGVAMVGDGINDAPALATATVGIAMGAAGTDTALETADIALMGDDLSRLPYVYELAHDANGVIRQNIWASLAVKALLAVGVPFGYVGVAHAVLIGDAGMTVGVTGNAMRLSRIRPDDSPTEKP